MAVNIIFLNQFGILRLLETWIMLEKLYGTISCPEIPETISNDVIYTFFLGRILTLAAKSA